jgi:glycogen operon protein
MNHIWTNGAAGRVAQLLWHGVRCFQPDWGAASHTLAFALRCRDGGEPLYVALNAFWEPLSFELPELPTGERWHRFVDTALAPPDDVAEPGQEPAVTGLAYPVAPRSAVVLVARRDG